METTAQVIESAGSAFTPELAESLVTFMALIAMLSIIGVVVLMLYLIYKFLRIFF